MKKSSKKIKSSAKWKPVEIAGSIIEGGEDFEGFAGLEILEDYDASFLLGNKNKNKDFSTSELEGDIYDARKRKTEDSDDEEEEDQVVKEKPKKKKLKEKPAPENIPGQFVMLKALEDDSVDALQDPENIEALNAWNQIGVTSENVLRALLEKKFFCPTEIQRVTIPASVHGKNDILGAAETGSGKTLAFGIPIIQNIEKMLEVNDDGRLYSIILTPTRELAQQIHQHLVAIAKYTKITVACIIGGLATVKQERVLKKNPHIVIGTPGRIWELIQDGNDHLNKINVLKFLVIDETDRMIEKGHFAELEHILQLVNSSEGSNKRQTFVFSATLTMVHELPDYLMKKKKQKPANMTREQRLQVLIDMFGMKSQKVFDITNDSGVAEKVIESRILCTIDEKDFYLYYILTNYPGRTIVFCNSIDCVKRTASVLTHLNISPIVLHGNMEQKQRLKNLEKFQKDENGIMVATQVAARGLDIPNIQHVIHYQVPTTGEDYVHRSGRTARANKEGLSILIMESGEVKYFVKLQKTLGRNEDLPIFPIDQKTMRNVRERVRMAREIELLDLQVRRLNDNRNWKKKAADDIGILNDSDDSDDESRQNRAMKQFSLTLKHKKLALGKLLSTQIVPNNIQSLKYPVNENMSEKIETNPIDVVKNAVARNSQKKNSRLKLFRKKK